MENGDFTKRFKNKMRLKILGNVAWLEVPRCKSRRRFTLLLTEAGGDAVTIDWRPANPEWQTGRLQLVVMEGERGLLEDEEKFWKLHQEYSQEEVEKLLQDARDPSRSGSPVLALRDGEDAVVPSLPSSSGRRQPAEWLGEGVAVVPGKRKPEEWLEEGCRTRGRTRPSAELESEGDAAAHSDAGRGH